MVALAVQRGRPLGVRCWEVVTAAGQTACREDTMAALRASQPAISGR